MCATVVPSAAKKLETKVQEETKAAVAAEEEEEEELPYIEPTLVAPCKHNRWMRQRVRLAAPSTNLECLTCGVVWTTNLDAFEKCREFYHARCALGSECPYPHIYAQGVSRIIKAGGPELTLKEFRKGVAEARRAGVYETVEEVLEWMVPYAKRLKGTPAGSAQAEDAASDRSCASAAELMSASGSACSSGAVQPQANARAAPAAAAAPAVRSLSPSPSACSSSSGSTRSSWFSEKGQGYPGARVRHNPYHTMQSFEIVE